LHAKWSYGEQIHHVPGHSSDRFHPEKGGRSTTERDEFQRAAWRVTVAAVLNPESLIFVDEMEVNTSLAPFSSTISSK
jgi:hypothetical protein